MRQKISKNDFDINDGRVYAITAEARCAHEQLKKDKYFKVLNKMLRTKKYVKEKGTAKVYTKILIEYYNLFLRDNKNEEDDGDYKWTGG